MRLSEIIGGKLIGTAAFDAGGGTITNKVVRGVISNVTRGGPGLYAVALTGQTDNNYCPVISAGVEDVEVSTCYFDLQPGTFTARILADHTMTDLDQIRIMVFRI